MEQRKSTSEGQSSAPAAPTAPAWMHHTMRYAPDRRAKMLEHMARARSMPQLQAVKATVPTGASVWKILRGAYGCIVLFSIIALFFQSLVPFYIGAFLFLTDGERIESALGTIGIRFEAGAIGPKIIKGFVSLFGWFALLVSFETLSRHGSLRGGLQPNQHGLFSPALPLRSPSSKPSPRAH